MHALVLHPLVEADLLESSLWYEAQQPGLGARFEVEAWQSLQRLRVEAPIYAIRFVDIRRMNLKHFPHGFFFFIESNNAIVLGVLHSARDTRKELERRRSFQG